MSATKRKRMLIGFAGLAVVLVAVIALVSPNFRSEDARGAIGAVQKHRETQIAPSDVILGSESAKLQARVLYADFLADAGTLQNAAGDLVLASRDSARLNQAETALASAELQFQQRYFDHLAHAVSLANESLANAEVQAMLGRAAVQELSSEMQSIESRLRDRGAELQQAEMAAFAQSVGRFAEALEARAMSRNFESLYSDLAVSLESRKFANLANIGAALADQVESRASLRDYADYLASAAATADSLANAGRMLAVRKAGAEQMESRELQQLQLKIDRLGAMMVAHASGLEAQALANMELLLAFDSEGASALARMSALLEGFAASAESRAHLNSFEQQLAGVRSEAASLAAFHTHNQFMAVRGQLQNQEELQGRVRNIEALQNFHLANADGFDAQLANLDVSIASNRTALASVMPDVDALSNQVRSLKDRAR